MIEGNIKKVEKKRKFQTNNGKKCGWTDKKKSRLFWGW